MIFAAAQPLVTVVSPCEYHDKPRQGRWAVKNDAALLAANASVIQAVTSEPHRVRENNCYSLTGLAVAVKVEADGDLHLALKIRPATLGIVVREIPARPQWCEIRTAVFVGRERAFLCTFNPRKSSRSSRRPSSP